MVPAPTFYIVRRSCIEKMRSGSEENACVAVDNSDGKVVSFECVKSIFVVPTLHQRPHPFAQNSLKRGARRMGHAVVVSVVRIPCKQHGLAWAPGLGDVE